MPNTNFQTFHQMGNAISNVVKQASGRDPVQNIDMDFVTVAQNKTLGEMIYTGNPISFSTPRPVQIQRILLGMNPKQDLHGYDTQWPGGGRGNLLDLSPATTGVAYGLTITKDNNTGTVTIAGTYSGSSATAGFVILFRVPYISDTKILAFDMNPDLQEHFNGIRWASTTGGNIAIDLSGLETNATYNFTLKPLICSNNITPTSWSPYSNICPITGWPGVAVTRSKEKLFTITDESVVQGTLISSSGANVTSDYRIRTNYIKVKPNTTYTVYANVPYLYIYEYSTDSASGYIQNSGSWAAPPKTFTTTETTEYIKLLFANATSTGSTKITPSDLTYCDVLEDAVSVRIPVTFPDPPGTVYQGTLNLISGALTITHLMQTFTGAESEDWLNSYGSNGFRIASRGMKVALLNTGLCNWLPVLSEVGNEMGVALGMNDSDIYVRHITDNLEIADLTEWRAYLAEHPLEILYPLEPEQSYQVTPQALNTLAGDNVIWTDADTMEVMYYQMGR